MRKKTVSHSWKGYLKPIIDGLLVIDNVLILCWWWPQFLRISRREKHPSSWTAMPAFRFGFQFLSRFSSYGILCLTMWMSFWKGDWGVGGRAGLVGAPLTSYLPEQTDRCYSACEWKWQQEVRVIGPSPAGEEEDQYGTLRAGLGN